MLLGYCAMFATLLVWASFFISLKFGVHSQLEPADIAITRFIIPSLILIPFVVKHLPSISAVPKRYKAGLIIGSGLQYLDAPVRRGGFYRLRPVASQRIAGPA